MKVLPASLLLTILLTTCSHTPDSVPCFPSPSDTVKQKLAPYQDKNLHPDTWAWFNQLLDLKEKLGECE